MNKITVEVKQEHIDDGRQCSSRYCPIAIALTEQYPGSCWVVGQWSVDQIELGQRKIWYLDDIGHKLVNNFDSGNYIYPCTVTLNDVRSPIWSSRPNDLIKGKSNEQI